MSAYIGMESKRGNSRHREGAREGLRVRCAATVLGAAVHSKEVIVAGRVRFKSPLFALQNLRASAGEGE